MFTISSVTLPQTQPRRSLFESQKWRERGVQRAVRLRLDQLLVDRASLGEGEGVSSHGVLRDYLLWWILFKSVNLAFCYRRQIRKIKTI